MHGKTTDKVNIDELSTKHRRSEDSDHSDNYGHSAPNSSRLTKSIEVPRTNSKPTIAFVGTEIHEFAGAKYQPYQKSLCELRELGLSLGFDLLAGESTVTTCAEAQEAAVELKQSNADYILVQASTFIDGQIALPLLDHDLPLGVWGVREPTKDGALPLNSFCGVNMMSSIRRTYLNNAGPMKFFWGNATDDIFRDSFSITVDVLRSIKAFKEARLGWVGGFADGFLDLAVDTTQLESRLGTSIHTIDLDTVIDCAKRFNRHEVQNTIEDWKNSADCGAVEPDQIERSIRVELALQEICREEDLQMLALNCWPKFQTDYQVMVCSTVGRLNEQGIATSCEGDVESALSMYLLGQLAQEPVTLVDMATLDERHDAVFLWHCGPSPASFADGNGVKLGCTLAQDAYGEGSPTCDLGCGNFLTFADGKYTIMRFTADADRALLLNGQFKKMDLPYWDGSRGWMTDLTMNEQRISALDLANTVVTAGFQHHFPLVHGDYYPQLCETMALLGIKPIEAQPYTAYLRP